MIKKIKKMNDSKQILFALLIGFAVISFWRGVWGLLDTYLFPKNLVLSLITSVLIGLGILMATHYTIKELE